MHNALLVAVVYGTRYLPEQCQGRLLQQPSSLQDTVQQLLFICVLHHQRDTVLCFHHLEQLDYILFRAQSLHCLHFGSTEGALAPFCRTSTDTLVSEVVGGQSDLAVTPQSMVLRIRH